MSFRTMKTHNEGLEYQDVKNDKSKILQLRLRYKKSFQIIW